MPIKFVDVDFREVNKEKGLREQNNHELAGSVEADDYGDSGFELIAESDWDDWAERLSPKLRQLAELTPIKKQTESSCVAHSISAGFEFRQGFQHGDKTLVSPISLYKRIGRSSSSGAYIPDGIEEIRDVGVLPLSNAANMETYSHTMPETGFSNRFPSGWESTAALFQVESWLRINNTIEWFSALMHGFPIVYGRDGHAILSVYPKKDRGEWYFGYKNSWGKSWGDGGFGFDSRRKIDRCIGYAVQDITFREQLE